MKGNFLKTYINLAMATEIELVEAVKELLTKGGHLNKLQAEIRSLITRALSDHQTIEGEGSLQPPEPSADVKLTNELVREYLEWNGYLYTATVLASEAAIAPERRTRTQICSEVGVKDDERSSSLPLLSNIISAYTERIRRKISRNHK